MWLPVLAAIESDPELRGRYQFWAFGYPTGNPVGYSALSLRNALANAYQVYPHSKGMVIINHSLGGVITHLQVIDSGHTAMFVQPEATDEIKRILRLHLANLKN